MQKIKIPINALVLALINLGAIFLSLEIYQTSNFTNNMAFIIAIIAVVASIFGYWIYRFIVKSFNEHFVTVKGIGFVYLYIFALIWLMIIFVPGYYLVQGYWPAFDNILMIWAFQLPTNFLTLFVVYEIIHKKS